MHTVYFALILHVEEWIKVDIAVEVDVGSAAVKIVSRGKTRK